MDIVEEYKHRMKTAPDDYLPGNEWDIVNELLRNPPDEIDTILEWIFVEHKGYIEPRVQAGLKFAERNPTKVWPALEQLISSSDPDDRDAALTVLEELGNPDKYYLAKPVLNDFYPYLRFEAAKLLAKIYPEEVKVVLRELAVHKTEEWIREQSRKLLLEMDKRT